MISQGLEPLGFGALMPRFVKDILLVASLYDCFILEEDGRFSDRMLREYMGLDLSSPPHFVHATSGKAALDLLKNRHFDLVLTTPHCADMTPLKLAARIKNRYADMPIAMLTYDRTEAREYAAASPGNCLDRVFLWGGDPKVLVALVKSLEDEWNAAHDTRHGLVRVIILVDDDPAFYSSFMPEVYKEVLDQCKSLLPERLNERDRHHRMRARPKILLATTFEDAGHLIKTYRDYLLGVFCDMRFPRRGKMYNRAGLALVRNMRKRFPEIPVMMQSWNLDQKPLAENLNVQFVHKKADDLFRQVGDFMKRNFGFGPFVFRMSDGSEVDRASDLNGMIEAFRRIPDQSLTYHGSRQDISNWLMARSEFFLARKLQPHRFEEFDDVGAVRQFLLETFEAFIKRRQHGQVTELPASSSVLSRDFVRIGSGSMGGKSRGTAFVYYLISQSDIHDRFPNIDILVPRTAVICTEHFDSFCEKNQLRERALKATSDEQVARLFLEQQPEDGLLDDLRKIVNQVDYPLAVRSSSLLEDSTYKPLAGLYETFMLPNNASSQELRLEQLSRAVRLVMASTFYPKARRYLEANSLRPEQEKMAVMVQRLVGRYHGVRFYPDFAGVAQSHNYYPLRPMVQQDGIATVALGFGRTVVEGHKALRFSPKFPNILPQMSNPRDALRSSQRDFYALNLSESELQPELDPGIHMDLLELAYAEKDGTLDPMGATYSPENNVIYDTIYREGSRLVNFAGILKYDCFPLAPLLQELLTLCREGMGSAVEIEFAVALGKNGRPSQMAVLELRPLTAMGHEKEVKLPSRPRKRNLIVSGKAMGNGVTHDIRDMVYIHPNRMELSKTRELAREVDRINHDLLVAKRPYILLGPGRWGTADHWMGIPVAWAQVSGCKAIVELEMPNTNIDPSQGAHFFHNLTSQRVGYFNINPEAPKTVLNFDWLEQQKLVSEALCIRHVRLDEPLQIRIDGRKGRGMILRGGEEPE